MNISRIIPSIAILLLICPLSAVAQTSGASHPLIEDTFLLGVGGFFPDKRFTIGVDGSVPGEEIDFDEIFRVDDSEATGAIQFRWRFGEKWSVQGQYWGVSDSGSSTLQEDVHWEDVIFEAGTNIGAGIEVDVARVFFGRRFSAGPQHEFALGLGLHWLEISAYMEGQILSNQGDSEFYRGSVSADAPLPNIGGWYKYAWSPKWAFSARIDWLDVSLDVYSGSLWNAQVGVNWAVFEHFGVTASWNFFSLDVDVDKSDWHGVAEITQDGPFLGLTANW